MEIRRSFNNKTKKFIYFFKKSKKLVHEPILLNRINSLKIPPAYRDVYISQNINSKIQAIGIDSKNRKQYIYNQTHIENQKKIKFSDLIYFGKKIKRIRKDMNNNIKKCTTNPRFIYNKNCIISVILYLIDNCNFRVGCEKYKKLYNTFGVTTLNNSHFKFNKNNIKIEFIGKKGIVNKDHIVNKNICNIIKELCKNNDDYIFYYLDVNNNKYRINEKHINNYLKNYHKTITVKMFRTWSANYILLKELLNLDLPDSMEKATKNISIAVKKAAENLHHTKSVSKKSYMNNDIVNLYLNNPLKFKRLIEFFRKTNGNLPSISRLLNLILTHLN